MNRLDQERLALVVATANKGKVAEIARLLEGLPLSLIPIKEKVADFDVVEDGETFCENAAIKALAAFAATGMAVVADDSGLCVAGLDGAPGVHSARFAGPGADDARRIEYLLERLEGVDGEGRQAWFACCLCAVVPDWLAVSGEQIEAVEHSDLPAGWRLVQVEGRLDGRIGHDRRGDRGFGYDPVFLPDATPGRTLAELSMEEKNALSHRGRAFGAFATSIRHSLANHNGSGRR